MLWKSITILSKYKSGQDPAIHIITYIWDIVSTGEMWLTNWSVSILYCMYRKTSNISRTVIDNKIVDNSDVVGASPVGAAPTTSSFST